MEIILNASKFSIPTTLTAAALYVGSLQLPTEYHLMPHYTFDQKPWEEQFVPKTLNVDFIRMEQIYQFAVALLQNTEDIPIEFAKTLNDDFWEIL